MKRPSEELFERPNLMKVFVSSEMRTGGLSSERAAAAEAIEKTGFAFPWWWEQSANAGPYSAENVCLGHARTSDGLVLILADNLTLITHKEYLAAGEGGAPRFIMLKAGTRRTQEAEAFLKTERKTLITVLFGSNSELQTQVTRALINYVVSASRKEIFRSRRVERSPVRALRSRVGKTKFSRGSS